MPEIEISQEDIEYVWQELQATPSYVEAQAARFAATDLSQLVAQAMDAPLVVLMEDEPRHTDDTPFCGDYDCPCHADEELFEEFIARPIAEGRLKTWEAQALLWPER